jgi:hypothetical protein
MTGSWPNGVAEFKGMGLSVAKMQHQITESKPTGELS